MLRTRRRDASAPRAWNVKSPLAHGPIQAMVMGYKLDVMRAESVVSQRQRSGDEGRKRESFSRRLPVGAEVTEAGVHFRVWAPKANAVAVGLSSESNQPWKSER